MSAGKSLVWLLALLIGFVAGPSADTLMAQKKGKGDLEDFGEDFGEEESDERESDDGSDFFLWIVLENLPEFIQLWGHTPETQFGLYPSHPYAETEGFAADEPKYRSYYFNTEFNYHHLGPHLRSYLFKWETQFVHRSKLAVDFALYKEDLFDEITGLREDRLSVYGIRYGYAVYRTSHAILNAEVGFRGLHHRTNHGGAELGVDFLLFPKKPLVIQTEVSAGYLNDGPLFTVESTAGILLGRFEILGGMRLLKSRDTILDGYRVGLRIWY